MVWMVWMAVRTNMRLGTRVGQIGVLAPRAWAAALLIPDCNLGLFLWLHSPPFYFLQPQGLYFFQIPYLQDSVQSIFQPARHFPIFNFRPHTISPLVCIRIQNAFHNLVLPCMRGDLRNRRTHPTRSNPPSFQTSLWWRVHRQV